MRARAICTRLRSPSERVEMLRLIRCAQPRASSISTGRVTSAESYSSFHRPRMAYEAVSTRSMTFSPGGTCSAIAVLVSPILGRRSKMSTSPSRSPSTSTVPSLANIIVATTWSRVVLPAPFGPIRIHRSSPCAVQSTLRSRTAASRLTSTPRSRSTSSDIEPPFSARAAMDPRAHWPPRPNLCHRGRPSPGGPANGLLRPPLVPDREQGGLDAVLHAELGQHRAYVRLHRLLRDTQGPRDLPVGAPLGEFGEHLALAAGERVQARGGRPGAPPADPRPRRPGRPPQAAAVPPAAPPSPAGPAHRRVQPARPPP